MSGIPAAQGQPIVANPATATSQPASPFILELYDRARQGFFHLENCIHSATQELELLGKEKAELFRHCQTLELEIHKHLEINARILNLLTRMLSTLSPEMQANFQKEIDLTKAEIEAYLRKFEMEKEQMAAQNQMAAHHAPVTQPPTAHPIQPHHAPQSQQLPSQLPAATVPGKKPPKAARPSKEKEGKSNGHKKHKHEDSQEGSNDILANLATLASQAVYAPDNHHHPASGSLVELEKDKKLHQNFAPHDSHTKGPQLILPALPTQLTAKENPTEIRYSKFFPHGDVVCSIALSNPFRHVMTGAKGCVKFWDVASSSESPIHSLSCLDDAYIRSTKLTRDSKTMFVAGETNVIAVWDLASPVPTLSSKLVAATDAVYALAITPDGRRCFACCSDGKINVWDIHNQKLIQSFSGHAEGASCVELSSDMTKLYSGGLDSTTRIWDVAGGKELNKISHSSQVFSLSVNSDDTYAVIGFENSEIEHLNLLDPGQPPNIIRHHKTCVLSAKFAPSNKWFLTSGKDGLLAGWKHPGCNHIFEEKETSSILCSEISSCGNFIATGSGDRRATLYTVL